MKLNWNFLGVVEGGAKQKTFPWGGGGGGGGSMDIFWNCTFQDPTFSHPSSAPLINNEGSLKKL